jgi:tetratricopeptide (TPR) repeat protein
LQSYTAGYNEDTVFYLERLATVRSLNRQEVVAYADAALRLNQFVAAESLFTSALGMDPENIVPVLMSRAHARLKLGELDDAASDYSRAADLDRHDLLARIRLASVLLDLNRNEEAARVARGFISAPRDSFTAVGRADSTLAFVLAARVEEREEKLEAALELAKKALRTDSESVDALSVLSRIHRKLGNLRSARAFASQHRKILERRTNAPRVLAMQFLVQGAIAAEAGDAEAALVAYKKGLEEDPANLNLHCVLGPLYQSLERRTEARASFTVLRKAMKGAAPGPLFLETGKKLRRRGLRKGAADQFERAVNRMPGSEEAVFFRALALSEMGEWNGAHETAAPLEAPLQAGAGSGRAPTP